MVDEGKAQSNNYHTKKSRENNCFSMDLLVVQNLTTRQAAV